MESKLVLIGSSNLKALFIYPLLLQSSKLEHSVFEILIKNGTVPGRKCEYLNWPTKVSPLEKNFGW